MTTRQEFRDQSLRSVLASTTAFSDAMLDQWIIEAVRDYSLHFPRELRVEVECQAGQRVYSLSQLGAVPAVYGITRVEYPSGLEPPQFLRRLAEDHPAFLGAPVWDFHDPDEIVIGPTPQAGEAIRVLYHTGHVEPVLDTISLSVPGEHLEGLKLFIVWQALKKLEMDQAAAPDGTSLLLSMLGANRLQAERAYQAKLQEYRQAAAEGGFSGPWRMDAQDRVY